MSSVLAVLVRALRQPAPAFLQVRKASDRIQKARLVEVGSMQPPIKDGQYQTGQLFLHQIFGYRGVILFPWVARVFDRDILKAKKQDTLLPCESPVDRDDIERFSKTNTFYQVLIDSRDCPYIRAQTEAVTFLGHHGQSSNDASNSSRTLYAIPGLDYVAHEDILPYKSTERPPIQHELFDKFLYYDANADPSYQPLETLKAWQKKNHPWLELSDVHRATTENIRVTVIPFYMGWRENSNYWWRYCIRLENLGDDTVHLRERHWRIFSLSGTLETVRGRGVVGQEPILSKKLPAFQYSSHVSLQCPAGHMWGTFKMERDDGYAFECKIPAFSLKSQILTAKTDEPQ